MDVARTGGFDDLDTRAGELGTVTGHVAAVHRSAEHGFSKATVSAIDLVTGQGVAGDAHAGATVKHRSRVARDPTQPNLRQIHLLQGELLDSLKAQGFAVAPGELGENVTTHGVDLLGLPRGSRLQLGDAAVVAVTGLRNPCAQIERFRAGLLQAVLDRDAVGVLVRKAGVMAVVLRDGRVQAGDALVATLPPTPHQPLAVV